MSEEIDGHCEHCAMFSDPFCTYCEKRICECRCADIENVFGCYADDLDYIYDNLDSEDFGDEEVENECYFYTFGLFFSFYDYLQ